MCCSRARDFGGWRSLAFEGGSGRALVGGRVLGLADDVPRRRLDAFRHGVALNRSVVRKGAIVREAC